MTETPRWSSRTQLPDVGGAGGLLFSGDPAEKPVPVSLQELADLRTLSALGWDHVGLKTTDRVLVSTASAGVFPVATNPEVLSPLCQSLGYANPQGRLRLLRTIKTIRPTVWVTTPCAALDFLARLYMEFNIDPFELGIEHIVLLGEIASAGTHKRLADEFEATITDVYCDPVFGCALSVGAGGQPRYTAERVYTLEALDHQGVSSDGKLAEIVLRFEQVSALGDLAIRSGQIVAQQQTQNAFHHTIGQQVLARGRWLSLPLLAQALKLIDGITAWQLQVGRGEGTLDRLELKVGLNRDTLISNPMWQARIREAVASVTPLSVNIDCYLLLADDPAPKGLVDDRRGHHLGGCGGLDAAGGWLE
jgi:hypothetical protein